MMVNPTKRQKNLLKYLKKKLLLGAMLIKKQDDIKLKEDAPKNIKDKYYLYMNS